MRETERYEAAARRFLSISYMEIPFLPRLVSRHLQEKPLNMKGENPEGIEYVKPLTSQKKLREISWLEGTCWIDRIRL